MIAPQQRVRIPAWLVGILLAGAVLAFYARACGTELNFVNFDDDYYVTANAHVQQGLTADSMCWAFTSLDAVNWHPMTWLSLALDAQLFGTGAAGFHRTNVLLHVANTVLLFWLLLHMTGALWCSAAVAALFGLHPAHVEAVAWVTSRKDVLSTLFWLLAVVAYVGYARRPAVGRYLLVVVPFVLGLMAKPMLVTLPATLLLLDYWPLRRWPAVRLRWLLLEKLPLMILVIPAVLLTLRAQTPIINSLAEYTLYDRVAGALVSYVRYLRMAIWPVDLAVLYPLPRAALPLWQPLAAGTLLCAITALVLWRGRSRQYLAVGWLWFLGTLVPVIGLVQNGPQALADRYTYVPYIGLFVALAWAVAQACTSGSRRRTVAVLTGTALVCCGLVSWRQLGYWRDSETLWRHTLAATTDNGGAHAMLAMALVDRGELPEAVEEFTASLRLMPDNPATHGNLALALAAMGRADEASAHLERSLELRPEAAMTHVNLARIRERQDRLPAALAEYTTALELDPRLTQAGVGRAAILARLGDFVQARAQLDRLIANEPDSAVVHTELGRLHKQQRQLAEAVACYDRALELQADYVDAWNGKGVALEGLGRFAEAVACYRRAVELRPGDLVYRLNLAYAASASGQSATAAEQFRAAFELQPRWPEVALAEAWALATHPDARRRDGALALRTATLVCRATNDQMPQALDVQAAAYAELGRFDEAVAGQRKVLALLGPDVTPSLRAALTERLRRYERREPYHEGVDVRTAGSP